MRFSWAGLILAPLVVPVMLSVAWLSSFQGDRPVLLFLLLLAFGCIVSYGTTIFLFLPCLFLLSLRRPMTGFKVCLLGLVLGAAVFVPLTLLAWKGSGPDSGPPIEGFLEFFVRWAADPLTAIFPVAGLITAGLYWWLGTWRRGRSMPARE
ncbi:MAG TPA: hypothetical protein VKT73_07425 [Xanthobacteraceae bacterium]|nr:hypothetical protein [Xanthobacteraceae bacterium]